MCLTTAKQGQLQHALKSTKQGILESKWCRKKFKDIVNTVSRFTV
jgi:hypothetical protein